MIANYLGLGAALIVTVMMLVLTDRKQDARAMRIHKLSRLGVPIFWILYRSVSPSRCSLVACLQSVVTWRHSRYRWRLSWRSLH